MSCLIRPDGINVNGDNHQGKQRGHQQNHKFGDNYKSKRDIDLRLAFLNVNSFSRPDHHKRDSL